jgi:hypothetical protein
MIETSKVQLQTSAKPSKGGGWGCFITVPLVFFAFFGTVMFVTGYLVDQTRLIPGDASRFDPVAAFEAVQQHAWEDAELVSIDAYYIRSDGTLDLNASYNPFVRYDFVRKLDNPPADAPPVGAGGGAGGGASGEWYEPVRVEVSRPWHVYNTRSGSSSSTHLNFGMDRDVYSPTSSANNPISQPLCSFAELWETAIAHDAPRDAVAIIQVNAEGYTFIINEMSIVLQFSPSCELSSERS